MGKRLQKIVLIFFLLFNSLFFSYTATSIPNNRDIHIMSIISTAYLPEKIDLDFHNFTIPNGSVIQVSSDMNLFRNLLIVLNENITEGDIIYNNLYTNQGIYLKNYQIPKILQYITKKYISLNDLIYSNRWSFFLFSYLKPPYEKPTNLFNLSENEWTTFSQGWYYIDETSKTVMIWTIYDFDALTLQKIGDRLTEIMLKLFPYQETIFLEQNEYLKDNLDFSANIIKDLNIENNSVLINDIKRIDEKMVECIDRKPIFYNNFEQLAFDVDRFYFSSNYRAFDFIRPMISDLNSDALLAILKNEESISNLQQSKNIIQNELSNRMNDETLQITRWALFLALVVFVVDIIFNIPKIFEKIKWWFVSPKFKINLKSYFHENGKLKQNELKTINPNDETKLLLNVNSNPILGFEIGLIGEYLSYYIGTVEVLAPPELDIEYEEIFAIKGKRPFIRGSYTDIWYNMKIFMDIRIVKGQVSDPTLLGFKLHHNFTKNEEKTITIKIRTSDCRKMYEKSFMIIGR